MVRIDSLPGVSVAINVKGGALIEHMTDDRDADDVAERYVQARSGLEFEIWVHIDEKVRFKGKLLTFKVSVDGNEVDQRYVTRKFLEKRIPLVSRGWVMGEGKIMKHSFQALGIAEGSASEYEKRRVAGLGTIEVQVEHMRKVRKEATQYMKVDDLDRRDNIDRMSETLLKGRNLSHSVAYSKVAALEKCVTLYVERVDPQQRPAATYRFHYRSLEALLSMGVLPRLPSNQAADSAVDDLVEEVGIATASSTKQIKSEKNRGPPQRRKRPSDEVPVIELDDEGKVVRETVWKRPKLQPIELE